MKPSGIFERVRFLESRLDRMEAVILAQDQTIRRLLAERAHRPEPAPAHAEPSRRHMAEISAMVAADNGLTVAELCGPGRAWDIVRPRQYAMMLMADAGHSQVAIGRFLGRDHTTVMHGIRAARARMDGVDK